MTVIFREQTFFNMGDCEMPKRPDESDGLVALMTEFQGRLYGYILTLLGDPNAANDVLQETNVVLWKESRQFEPGTNFKAWSFRIAHFQCMAYRQKQLRDKVMFNDEVVAVMASESKELDDLYEERALALERCLEQIQPRSREALRLRYAEELAVNELARKMNRTPNAISQLLFRARQWLIECVKGQISAEVAQ
jgi:RNA polymerase sigma-70 factor, ECF subfamily